MDNFLKFWNNLTRNQKRIIIGLAAAIVLVLVYIGVSAAGRTAENEGGSDTTATSPTTTASTAVSTTTSKPSTSSAPPAVNHHLNPFTGLPFSDEEMESVANRRPLLVSYDNINDAWPQSGIGSADYYMEILAEGLITRFLAIYYSNPPEIIGPIRSARPYIVLKAIEHDAFLAHVGGSQQALSDIAGFGVADLDGLWSGAFRRVPPKVAPHNTYAKYEDLMEEAKNQGYRMKSDPVFYSFGKYNEDFYKEDASAISFHYRDDVYGDGGYSVKYLYDGERQEYTRYVNGSYCIDEIDGNPLKVSNILVQYAAHEVLDNEGRLAIDLYSGGEGFLLRDGKISKIRWEKEDRESLTKFYHEDGSEIVLRPGKTILHVVYSGIFDYE